MLIDLYEGQAFRGGTSEVATGFEPVYTALQAVASPLGHATVLNHRGRNMPAEPAVPFERMTRFELATLTLAR